MDFYSLFQSRFPYLIVEREFPFSKHTTIGCGGVAELAISPRTLPECASALEFLRNEKIPHCFLGCGANSLPPSGKYNGVVVRFHKLHGLCFNGSFVYAEAGVTGGSLIRFAVENGFGGFEPFTGMPTSVGGGIAMNAGVPEAHFSDLVESVIGVENGTLRVFSKEECAFSEKNSVFLEGIAVLGAYFRPKNAPKSEIQKRLAFYRQRRKKLPKGRSMGCAFVNPAGQSAGAIIDGCGLKGVRIGGARVSEIHANFILNEGGTSEDVQRLLALVRERVYQKTGILLREEIRRLGKSGWERGNT